MTDITSKYIAILMYYYNDVYIYKPLTSRYSNSEKYIICINYKGLDNNINKLDKIYNHMEKNKLFIVDIFSNYLIPDELFNFIKNVVINLLDLQINYLEKSLDFIENDNNLLEMITNKEKNCQLWINNFYPLNK
jgi:hypothetical protein